MTRAEARLWIAALCSAAYGVDPDGEAFLNELTWLLIEFRDDTPIQRKPY